MQHLLYIVCGNAGVGKTTYGISLAAQHGACLLDIDTVSEKLVQAGLQAAHLDIFDRDSARFKQIYRDAIHDTLFAIACQNLAHQMCIIVAPFTQERRDPAFLDQCKRRVGGPVQVIYLSCSETTRKQRLIDRGNPRDANKLSDWESYSEQGRDTGPPPFAHRLIFTDQSDQD